ncbi:MAG: hypothetical protein WD069_15430 [Planctomycetales bacterium]
MPDSGRSGSSSRERLVYHYTDEDGYKAIASQPVWKFKASRPERIDNPFGAYFTTEPPDAKNLAEKIGVSWQKTRFYFAFADYGDLRPVGTSRPARYQRKFYSPIDYEVELHRQRGSGENPSWT